MAQALSINYHLDEIEGVKNYYADLLIMQYRHKPNARETIKLGVDIFMGDSLLFQLQDILDIDKAIGVQLDIIGKILGCPRNVPGVGDEKNYFSFEKEDAYGFSDINGLSQGYFKSRRLHNLSIYSLSDDDYRQLLKLKALANVQRGSWAEMDTMLYNMFGNDLKLVNNKDLSITYLYKSNLNIVIESAIKLKYLRSPIGVNVSYVQEV